MKEIDFEKEKLLRKTGELQKQLDSVTKQFKSQNKKIEAQSKKIEALTHKFGSSIKEIKSLKGKLSTSERKRKSLMSEKKKDKKNSDCIPLIPIDRHQFSELMVRLAVEFYVNTRCGLRSVVVILKILKTALGWDITIPSYKSVKNWVIKSGYAVYHEPDEEITKEDYTTIVDDSMMVGSQRLLLILGSKSEHQGKPLSHNDVSVLGMAVRQSWDGESVSAELDKVSTRVDHPPLYVISDNASIMKKGISKSNLLHIRDISHTLGMIMERVYKKEKEFISFLKDLATVKRKAVMTIEAYLLPPKQREIARFLNLVNPVNWAKKMLTIFKTKLNSKERKLFAFIPKHASFINELDTVLSCINTIAKKIKNEGLSRKSVKFCIEYIKQNLYTGNERMLKVAQQMEQYLEEEVEKLPESSNVCWHASSDIIESLFGVFKDRKSPNPLYGVTPFIFLLPLYTRIGTKEGCVHFDFKHSLESVFMRDIDGWKKENLFENQVYKRTKKLKSA